MQKRPLDLFTTEDTDLSDCRAKLRNGSKSFYAASVLLPKRVRDPATALYAFCREADDIIDTAGGSIAAIEGLRRRLDRIYRGVPDSDPIDRALARVVRRHAIPRRLPDALIEGFEWDAAGRRYANLGELKAYATRVAGTVGAMMAVLMGAKDPQALARACDLGVAMQLTNIARDVGEDARAGRIYLPLDWLQEAGIDPGQWLKDPVCDDRIAGLTRRLLEVADDLYRRSEDGIAALAFDCRAGISAAGLIYREIGAEVANNGYDSVSRRAVVSRRRKLSLLTRALTDTLRSTQGVPAPVLAEAAFLVASVVEAQDLLKNEADEIAWWDLRSRTVRIIELFERLGRVDRNGELPAQLQSEPA